MNFQKTKPIVYILFLLLLAGFTTPMTAQGKNIIGKQNTYKKTRKTSNQPNSQSQKATQPAKVRQADTKNLAEQITRGKTTDAQKAESIFNWMITTIEYDVALRLDKSLQQKIYISEENVIVTVLNRKKALCGGYALLFERLCEDIGLEAETIHGYTKTPGVKKIPNQANHSWNAIKINGVWQLLDITWAISQSTAGTKNSYWYLTPPSQFIKTHYPEDKKWALNNSIKNKSEFFLD